jgi:hypothetical protein
VAGHDHVWFGANTAWTLTPSGRRDYMDRYQLNDLLKRQRITYPGEKDGAPEEHFLSDGGPLYENHLLGNGADFIKALHVNYLPLGPDRLRVFLLTNIRGRLVRADKDGGLTLTKIEMTPDERDNPHWSLTAYDFQGEWKAKEKEWGEGKWSGREPIAVAFKEAFQVAARGDDYYFITTSGKVYRSPKPDKGKERKTEAVWEDAKRPVVAFLQDIDAGKSFVFCKQDKDGKGVYFELAAKPEECPYDARGIKPAKADDPLPAVLGYAKVLLADKKIKEK